MELVTPSLGLLVWTSFIFLSIFIVLRAFAWKPIAQALSERENYIAEALNSAERAKDEMAKLKADNEVLLQEARAERDRIIKEAQSVATGFITDAKEKATIESNKIVENARLQITNEKNAAMTELKNLVAATSIQIAEQIIKKNLNDDSSQKALIEEFLKESKLN